MELEWCASTINLSFSLYVFLTVEDSFNSLFGKIFQCVAVA